MNKLAFLPALFALGCTTPVEPDFGQRYLDPFGTYISQGCSAADEALIDAGVAAWEFALPLGSIDLVKYDHVTSMPVYCKDGGPHQFGTTYRMWPSLHIIIDPDRTGPSALRTVIHEFGHAFGLDHSKEFGDVMYTPNTENPNISRNDVAAFCALWNCP